MTTGERVPAARSWSPSCEDQKYSVAAWRCRRRRRGRRGRRGGTSLGGRRAAVPPARWPPHAVAGSRRVDAGDEARARRRVGIRTRAASSLRTRNAPDARATSPGASAGDAPPARRAAVFAAHGVNSAATARLARATRADRETRAVVGRTRGEAETRAAAAAARGAAARASLACAALGARQHGRRALSGTADERGPPPHATRTSRAAPAGT